MPGVLDESSTSGATRTSTRANRGVAADRLSPGREERGRRGRGGSQGVAPPRTSSVSGEGEDSEEEDYSRYQGRRTFMGGEMQTILKASFWSTNQIN